MYLIFLNLIDECYYPHLSIIPLYSASFLVGKIFHWGKDNFPQIMTSRTNKKLDLIWEHLPLPMYLLNVVLLSFKMQILTAFKMHICCEVGGLG